MSKAFSLRIDKEGIANLSFDLPNEKVNKLSAPVLKDLDQILDSIRANREVSALIISSNKQNIFIAGADINEIKDITEEKDALKKVSAGQNILDKIANLKIPTLAVINGACLGGGLELALACDYRIASTSNKVKIGLPEVNLGIIPGFGGCVRLPRLVGIEQSLKIILTGKAIEGGKAYKIGLVDDLSSEEFLDHGVKEFVAEILSAKSSNKYISKRKRQEKKRRTFEKWMFGKFITLYFAQKNIYEKTKGQYPAPFYAIDVIRKTYGMKNTKKALKIELEAFCELVVGDISKNLIQLFFTSENLKKEYANPDLKDDIKNVAVLGAGIMGGGIAWLFAKNDINVRIKDLTKEGIAIGYQQIVKIFSQLKKIRKITASEIDLKLAKVTSTTNDLGFESTDLAIEAIIEDMAIKKQSLAKFEQLVDKDTIIVSNTSSLSITEMSGALKRPKQFAGMHFFNPVNRMPLVEVIYGEKTSDQTIERVVNLTRKIGKTPIVVKDVSGFLVNRILLPCMNEACYMLEQGASIQEIDQAIEDFGMPMGPFILADTVGIDVVYKVAKSLEIAYGKRMKVSSLLEDIYKNHNDLLGKKSGKGFYQYEKSKALINPRMVNIIRDYRRSNQVKSISLSESQIVNRFTLSMINEAAKCLEENVVKNAAYLDMAMIMGSGFPAFRGGILRYADKIGINQILGNLQDLEKDQGIRFEISKMLIDLQSKSGSFY